MTKINDMLNNDTFAVIITDGFFGLNFDCDQILLRNINIAIPSNKLTVLTGPTGSGKSLLISAMIGEMVKISGHIVWSFNNQTFGYLPQVPWLFNSTLQENILFGEPFNLERYQQVLEACDFNHDIKLLPKGDQTQIGDNGFNLSGGQKQRIALARAIYSSASTIILDDPLSALDQNVASLIIDRAIINLLLRQNRTVIMVTYNFKSIQRADRLIYMNRGQIIYNGTFEHLQSVNPSWLQNLIINSHLCSKSSQKQKSLNSFRQTLTRTQSSNEISSRPKLTELYRQISCYDPYFLRSLNKKWVDYDETLKFDSKVNQSNQTRLTWNRKDKNTKNINCNLENHVAEEKILISFWEENYINFDQDHQTKSTTSQAYWLYFKACSPLFVFIILGMMILSQVLKVITDLWLIGSTQLKSESSTILQQSNKTAESKNILNSYITEYCTLSVLSIVLSFVINLSFQLMSLRAVRILHTKLIRAVVSAPLRFFETTFLGRIINCFSSDILTIDKVT